MINLYRFVFLLLISFMSLGLNPKPRVSANFTNIHLKSTTNFTLPFKQKEVKWLTFEEAQKLSTKNPKKIFIDVYTDWCGWCKKMDKTTLKDPIIANYLDKKFYSVKLNAESSKLVNYKGKQITESELATKIFRATGYPTTVYLDEQQNLLQPISSYLEVDMLDKILHFYGDNYYKNSSWESFDAVYSRIAN